MMARNMFKGAAAEAQNAPDLSAETAQTMKIDASATIS